MTKGWQRRAPRVRILVPCDGREHLVVWCRGSLVLADHPDPLGELALGALGGVRPPCIELANHWRAGTVDPRAPDRVALFRTPSSLTSAPSLPTAGAPQGIRATVFRGSRRSPLPEPLRRARTLTMLGPEGDRVWRDRLRTEAGAALGSVGLFGRDLRLADTAPRGGTATLVHRRGVGLELALADRWLTHVWTRGLDRDRSPRGTFVVDAATAAAPDGTLTVTLLRIDGRGRPSLEVARLDPRDGVGPISG